MATTTANHIVQFRVNTLTSQVDISGPTHLVGQALEQLRLGNATVSHQTEGMTPPRQQRTTQKQRQVSPQGAQRIAEANRKRWAAQRAKKTAAQATA